jgi:large subunit ribosomal protein L22
MRLVIDQIRGMQVNEALAMLQFSKKHAAVQIDQDVVKSAVANAERRPVRPTSRSTSTTST